MSLSMLSSALVLAAIVAVGEARLRRPTPPQGINFFAIGDWGHNVPAALAESGIDYQEQKVADIAGKIGDFIKPSFYVALGDNFYENGVANTTDPIWNDYYRAVWTAESTQVPWYPIMGNHEYYVIAGGSAQAQIDYYYEHRDNRWIFPDYQYTRKWTIPGSKKTVEIVFINTPALCPETSVTNIGWLTDKNGIKLTYQPVLQWIDNTLRASTADFLIVAGHYQIYTNAAINDGVGTVEYNCTYYRLLPVMQKYGVIAYMHGHKHNFQHHFKDNIHHFDVGHSSDRDSAITNGNQTGLLYNKTIGGFAYFNVNSNNMNVAFIDYLGNWIYNASMYIPSTRKAAKDNAFHNHGLGKLPV